MSFEVRLFVAVGILFLSVDNGITSRITFQNGRYNDILVAIHPEADGSECKSIIGNIREIFGEAGSQLFTATNGEATYGSINILLPLYWTGIQCGVTKAEIGHAKIFHTYDAADLKISMQHPIAKILPWTKQYKGCENESETLYIPREFLLNSAFTKQTKGKLLNHEWLKFRYGVFDEFGFFDDPFFTPCYTRGGNQYYTSCTNIKFESIRSGGGPISPSECRYLIAENSENLTLQLRQANSSVLFAPHFENINGLCTNMTHNGLSPTRQNVFCERKSVSEVIYSHADFKTLLQNRFFPNNRLPRPSSLPLINLIQQQGRTKNPGYVFIIEDSDTIRESGRLEHVKQGIAQMFRMPGFTTDVALYRYTGLIDVKIVQGSFRDHTSYLDRINFLAKIPDSSTRPPTYFGTDRISRSWIMAKTPLNKTISAVLQGLDSNVRWNLILITSQTPVDIQEGLQELAKSEYPLSVLTFDTSKDWLNFHTIPNTEKIIFLPHCFKDNNVCSWKTSSLVADHLIQLVANEEEPRRFIHKVVDIPIKILSGTFIIENRVPEGRNLVFHLPVHNDKTIFRITSPIFRECHSTKLLGYNLVLEVKSNDCPYQEGVWRYTIESHPENSPINYNLRGYIETRNTEQDLVISSTTGHKMELEVFPTMNRFPFYVSVMNKREQPIIEATVELEIDYEGNSFDYSNVIILKDDGIDPDITADDGVYSTFITTFNSVASYHTPQIHVQTRKNESRAIKSLGSDTLEAALLDSKLSSKCCGSKVPIGSVINIEYSYYTQTLSSFRTGESIDPSRDIIPPSKIYSQIMMSEEAENYLTYEFSAPGSNNNVGRVKHYDICCTPSMSGNLDDSMNHNIETTDCDPVNAGFTQSCRVYRSDLYDAFLKETVSEPEVNTTLYCGFRGVDQAGNNGPISSFLVDIPFEEYIRKRAGVVECASISDGCLPIEVFWGLVACIGGLILILFIILICWCCMTKKNKSKKEKEKLTDNKSSLYVSGENRRSSDPESLRNVYINQAYIHDSNGQLRLVASDGQLFPTSGSAETELNDRRSSSSPGIRRRSVSTSEINHGTQPLPLNGNNGNRNSIKHVSWNSNPTNNEKDKDIPILFSPKPTTFTPNNVVLRPNTESYTVPKNKNPSPIAQPQYFSNTARPKSEIRNQNKYDSFEGRQSAIPPWDNNPPQVNNDLNRGRGSRNMGNRTIPTMNNVEPPIYASVQRFARKPVKTTIEPFNHPTPMNSSTTRGTGQFSPTYKSDQNITKERAPSIGSAMKPEGFSFDSSVRSRPPVRMDHFPSSESEAYSDMSHILPRLAVIMNNPLIPPPIPISSVPSKHFETNNSLSTFPPTPMARTQSRENGTTTATGVKTPELSRPRTFPQPPPPPRQFRSNQNPGEDDDEYDDDSDNWDNYDEFEFTPPGTSYA